MYSENLQKIDDTVVLFVPQDILTKLNMKPGMSVNLFVSDGKLVVEPEKRKKYTLDELLAQCDPQAPFPAEDKEWLSSPPVGRELI